MSMQRKIKYKMRGIIEIMMPLSNHRLFTNTRKSDFTGYSAMKVHVITDSVFSNSLYVTHTVLFV